SQAKGGSHGAATGHSPAEQRARRLDHALVGDSLDRDQAWPGLDQGAVGRARIGPLGGAAEVEEGLRRAAAQASERRLRLHPLGQARGPQQYLRTGRLFARDQRHGARGHDGPGGHRVPVLLRRAGAVLRQGQLHRLPRLGGGPADAAGGAEAAGCRVKGLEKLAEVARARPALRQRGGLAPLSLTIRSGDTATSLGIAEAVTVTPGAVADAAFALAASAETWA